jgi:hypothetical protein
VLSRDASGMPVKKEQALVEQVKRLQNERDELIKKLDDALQDGRAKVEQLRQELKIKDEEIQELLVRVSETPDMEFPPQVVAKRPPKPADAGLAVAAALRGAAAHLSGCFREWQGRRPATDANLTVTLSVSPRGVSHGAVAVGVDDSVLPVCVADAIKRVPVPAPGMVLRMTVGVSFTGGVIEVEPDVTGVEPDTSPIDLAPIGSKPGLIDLN